MRKIGCILELPPEILANIFLRLPEQSDQLNIRQTCHYFRDISDRPEFFRKRMFSINGEDKEAKTITRYLDKFGLHLQDLTLEFDNEEKTRRFTSSIERRITGELQDIFMYTEQQRQLRSLKIDNYCLLQIIIRAARKRAAILASLQSMLEQQDRLSVLELTNFDLDEEEGCQLLLVISTLTRLTKLTLPNFFSDLEIAASECPTFLEVMGRFTGLNSVALSYHFVSHNVVEQLILASTSLRIVLLYIQEDDMCSLPPSFTPPDWQWVVKKRPEMHLWLDIGVDFPPYLVDFFSSAMPLVNLSLDIYYLYVWTSQAKINTHIADIKAIIAQYRLRKIILKQYNEDGPWSRPGVLVKLLEVCPYLTQLCLHLTLPSSTLQQLTAAVPPPDEGERSTRPPLQIHIKGLEDVREKNDLERLLQPPNLSCTVLICHGCELKL